MNMTEAQNRVFLEAQTRLSVKPWYRGICCDQFPSDSECQADFEDAVSCVMVTTAMWDDPDFFDKND